MRKYLLGGLITIAVLGLVSYTTTDNGSTEANIRKVFNIPLKQKKVVTTEDINYVNKLVGSGYVLQFVTERQWGTGDSHTRYTLVKY
jgi:hypothetical protein